MHLRVHYLRRMRRIVTPSHQHQLHPLNFSLIWSIFVFLFLFHNELIICFFGGKCFDKENQCLASPNAGIPEITGEEATEGEPCMQYMG